MEEEVNLLQYKKNEHMYLLTIEIYGHVKFQIRCSYAYARGGMTKFIDPMIQVSLTMSL